MFSKHYVRIKDQKLNEAEFYSGGGMAGGYYRRTVKRQGDCAVIYTEKAEMHNEEPVQSEVIVDATILDEIEKVIIKHRMNSWNNKKFTDMFVADGESRGYSFSFEKSTIRFSSQIYPEEYREKLREIEEIIKKYS
ncbi:MAG: hypothetical protein MJ105_09185 [Lachnospiraceae bacterium]|nr:hypothetical protein [Lachnospiraceae bacterium]